MLASLSRYCRQWLQRIACWVLRAGYVPRHVAFIMDGNRRFSAAHALPVAAGHAAGFEALVDALGWCADLGVEAVSVFAFSTENFKRSSDEVAALMRLAEDKLGEVSLRLASRRGGRDVSPRLRVVGDMSRLPPSVIVAAARAVVASEREPGGRGGGGGGGRDATAGIGRGSAAQRPLLYVCFAYTGAHDERQAAEAVAAAVATGWLRPGDEAAAVAAAAAAASPPASSSVPPSPDSIPLRHRALLASCALWGAPLPPPVGLLVRTSGETRLSGFAWPGSTHALLAFVTPLWPDLKFRHLVVPLLRCQAYGARLAADAAAARAAAGGGGGGGGGGNGGGATAEGGAARRRCEAWLAARSAAHERWWEAAARGDVRPWPPAMPLPPASPTPAAARTRHAGAPVGEDGDGVTALARSRAATNGGGAAAGARGGCRGIERDGRAGGGGESGLTKA